jgi:hypothetical protein
VLGILNKNGTPKFSKEYLQMIIPDENVHNLGYLGFLILMIDYSFTAYTPLLLYALIIVCDTGAIYIRKNPNISLPSIVKEYTLKVADHKGQLLDLKAGIEIYMGFYLMVGWFLGFATLFSIIFYWQYMRIKYMINSRTQTAFTLLRIKIDTFMCNPSVPGIVITGWEKIKSGLRYLTSVGH